MAFYYFPRRIAPPCRTWKPTLRGWRGRACTAQLFSWVCRVFSVMWYEQSLVKILKFGHFQVVVQLILVLAGLNQLYNNQKIDQPEDFVSQWIRAGWFRLGCKLYACFDPWLGQDFHVMGPQINTLPYCQICHQGSSRWAPWPLYPGFAGFVPVWRTESSPGCHQPYCQDHPCWWQTGHGSFEQFLGKTCHVPKKPNSEQHCIMPVDSKNVYGTSRLQRLNNTVSHRNGFRAEYSGRNLAEY